MKKRTNGQKIAFFAIVTVVASIAVFFGPSILAGNNHTEPSDSGLSAAISFREPNQVASIVKADYFSLSPLQTAPLFAVTNTQGQDVSNSQMIVQLKGRVITANVPVKDWTVTGQMQIIVDGKLYDTYIVTGTGTGNPPNPIVLNVDASPEASIPVNSLKQFWGEYAYGDHVVAIATDAKLTVNFVDNTNFVKDFKSANIGSVTLKSSSDATATFEVTSNYESSGTTTQTGDSGSTTTNPTPAPTTTITDTWTSVSTNKRTFDGDEGFAMKITDASRQNKELVEVYFTLYKPSDGSPSGNLQAYLGSSAISAIASSDAIPTSQLSTSAQTFKFTFPSGTKTPSGIFYIGIKNPGGANYIVSNINIAVNENNPYSDGYVVNFAGSSTGDQTTADLVGKVVYR